MPPQGESKVNVRRARSKSSTRSSESVEALRKDQILVDDRVYDANKLASMHPGGEMFVRAFAGNDASDAFLSYHRRRFPHAAMTSHLATASASTPPKTKTRGTGAGAGTGIGTPDKDKDKDFLELCQAVENEISRLDSWAPWHYYVKVLFILGSAVSLEGYMHYHADYRWQLSAVLGFFMALIGLNIQHDANHGAVSRKPWVNRALGLSQNWIGGSAVDWIHQHVVQHHINCNDIHEDPDIMGGWLLRLNPTKPLLQHQSAQFAYVFVLLTLFGFNAVVQSILHLVRGKHLKVMSDLLFSYRVLEACTWLLFVARWVFLPVYSTGSAWVLLSLAPMYSVAGLYLSFFFIISHNFEGSELFDQSSGGKDSQKSFLYKQVASSSNVGGAFLAFLNGGLNYQIEHHLFPRMSHCYYPRVAPIVRAFCEKRGIPYKHFPTIVENVSSTVTHLYNMGREGQRMHIRT